MRSAPLTLTSCLLPLLLVGCGEGGKDDPTDAGPRTVTIQLTEGGALSISGQLSMPEATPAGHMIQFTLDRLTAPAYFSVEGAGSTNGDTVFDYRIVNATDGDYKIRFRVDLNDSGQFDTGDLEGYYDGTVSAPIQDRSLAATLTLAGSAIEGADFGIGSSP